MTTAHPGIARRVAITAARLATHVVFLAAVVAVLAQIYPQLLGRTAVSPAVNREAAPTAPVVRAASASAGATAATGTTEDGDEIDFAAPLHQSALAMAGDGSLFKVPQLQTIIPKRPREELIIHTAVEGDNLSTLAERYDVDVDTLIWANAELEEDPDYLVIGQKLVIPPVSGVLYTVKTGDTLEAIATTYKGELRTMVELEFNHLSEKPTVPISGTQIMIPGGEKAYQPRLVYIGGRAVMVNAPRGGGRFVWPAQGWITTYWEPNHRAIDIGAPEGTPIYASDAGVVVSAGWNGDYGIALIIDHGNGFQTVYAHLSTFYPGVGQNVRRGQAIGKMGNTGKSTGPHLHFEIRYQGGNVNPMRYLPQ
jgi:murein DD-endopeptidase MepM/ murein hydrolase activator NlpD